MPLTPDERAALVARYRGGYAAFAEALAGCDDLDAAVEGWTPRQVAHHLGDSEMTSAIRLRRLLAEDEPVIAAYDENAFARLLHYDSRPVEASLRAAEAARATNAELLDRLTEDEWARRGSHTDSGAYGVEDWLRTYAEHPYDHAEQVRRARR
ncbi:MAG TPA: DinB family protein [Frankiaceae bacterium]|nr:DinB family protein [Frankiaceae bacterium]